MRKQTSFAIFTIAACALVASGGLVASNLAFKLNYRLNGPASVGGAGTGKNTLSLPYIRQTGVNDALQLILNIGDGTLAPVANVSRFLEATDSFCVYTGRRTPCQIFALSAGEGYFVSMISNVNYIVVGSHDPSVIISLEATTPGVSASGKNLVAVPYNINATDAQQVMEDIGGGDITPVASISRFNQATDTYQVYTGRMGTPAAKFPILLGEAYFISMKVTIPWIPSHF